MTLDQEIGEILTKEKLVHLRNTGQGSRFQRLIPWGQKPFSGGQLVLQNRANSQEPEILGLILPIVSLAELL